jgi:hypothetical protein
MGSSYNAISALLKIEPTDPKYMLAVATLINQLVPGTFTEELSKAFTTKWVTTVCEGVCLRKHNGSTDVFLRRYTKKDMPDGVWRCPETIWRAGETETQVLERLAKEEFGCQFEKTEPITFVPSTDEHSTTTSCLYLVVANPVPTAGEWFEVEKLPDTIRNHHRNHILSMALRNR